MFYITRKIGSIAIVYDDEDGMVDSVPLSTIKAYPDKSNLSELQAGTYKLVSKTKFYDKQGRPIINDSAKIVSCMGGVYNYRSNGKTYKFSVAVQTGYLYFNNGICITDAVLSEDRVI